MANTATKFNTEQQAVADAIMANAHHSAGPTCWHGDIEYNGHTIHTSLNYDMRRRSFSTRVAHKSLPNKRDRSAALLAAAKAVIKLAK